MLVQYEILGATIRGYIAKIVPKNDIRLNRMPKSIGDEI